MNHNLLGKLCIAIALCCVGCADQKQSPDLVGDMPQAGAAAPAIPTAGHASTPIAPSPSGANGGNNNSALAGSGGMQAMAGSMAAANSGSAGTAASSSAGNTAGGSSSSGGASGAAAGAAGMSGSDGAAGTDDPLGDLLTDPSAGSGSSGPADPAMCKDAFCFDFFDCAIFHPDLLDCGFTDCVDFVCVQ